MPKNYYYFLFIIICFSQCQNVVENTLINSPNTVDTTKFPIEEYAYVKSYSFNRIMDLDSLDNIISEMNRRKDSSHHKIEGVLMSDGIVPIDSYFGDLSIIDKDGNFAVAAQFIKNLSFEEIRQLQNILVKNKDGIRDNERCMSVYHDALIFYDKNDEVVDFLNFDLGCHGRNIAFDNENWEKLRQFFIDLGHPILKDKN